jgi:hypothetical protein
MITYKTNKNIAITVAKKKQFKILSYKINFNVHLIEKIKIMPNCKKNNVI